MATRSRLVVRPFGIGAVSQYHRKISYVTLALIIAHPVIGLIEDSPFGGILNLIPELAGVIPIVSPWCVD